tara:strand:+ start:182 stop:547 length:366 start_codon:yes stop_codon:yes gene_type:complete
MKTGIVYRLYNDNLMYFGSTTIKLNRRMNNHRAKWRRWKKGKSRYNTSFKILEQGDCKIEPIYICDFENKKELFEVERFYIENFDCVNKFIPLRTQQEYYLDNIDYLRKKRIIRHEKTGKW